MRDIASQQPKSQTCRARATNACRSEVPLPALGQLFGSLAKGRHRKCNSCQSLLAKLVGGDVILSDEGVQRLVTRIQPEVPAFPAGALPLMVGFMCHGSG